jgi:hypothetical protein
MSKVNIERIRIMCVPLAQYTDYMLRKLIEKKKKKKDKDVVAHEYFFLV